MKISTSILNAENRIECVKKLNKTNTSYIHVDVMDGIFVSDTQFSTIKKIKDIATPSKYKLDIHLMVENPIEYIEQLCNMNIEYITFHIEVEKDIKEIISKIKEENYKVGISIKPNTDIEKITPYLKDIDLILIMSVEPGKGGQEFLTNTPERINKVKEVITKSNYDIKIEVDGGINDKTIALLDNVDIAVVGTYITKSNNYYQQIEKLLNKISSKTNCSNHAPKYKKTKIILSTAKSLFIHFVVFGIVFGILYIIYNI